MCSTENHEKGICYDTNTYGASVPQGAAYSGASGQMGSHTSGGLERLVGNYK